MIVQCTPPYTHVFINAKGQQEECLRELTFNVTLEELWQDAVGSQLVKHAAEELLGYTCYIPWDQHAADKKI